MTSWWGWAARRARFSGLLLGTLLALVTVTTAILAFVVGHAGVLGTEAARAALLSAEPGAGAVQAQTRIGDDPAAQDRTARAKLTEGFAPAPVSIVTSYVSEPRRATAESALDQRVTLWAGDHLVPGLLSVTEGTWPTGPTEAALQADAAAALGLTTGSTLTVDDRQLTITALWEAAERDNPLWFGDPLVIDGADATSAGPLIVAREALTGGTPFLRWSVIPDADRITPDDLEVLAESAERAKALVAEADLTGRGIVVDGELASTAERAARDWKVGSAFGVLPVSVLLLVAAVGLVQVAGLLAATRQQEHELLAARGAGRGQLLATGLGEVTVVGVLGATLGTAVALGALWLVAGSTAHTRTVVLGGAGSLLLALVCLWVVTVRATRTTLGRPRADRVRAVAGAAAVIIVFAAAGLTTWQLRRSTSFELVPALAPALLLAAAAVVGLVALGPLTRLVEAVTKRGRTGVWLAGAQLARGLVVHAVPVTLTILATGTATFASLYAGTASTTHRDLTLLSNGAPLRAGLTSLESNAAGLKLPDLASVAGIDQTLPVWMDDSARVGDLTIAAMAAPTDRLDDVITLPDALSLPDLPTHTTAVPPIEIPAGSSSVELALSGRLFLDDWQQLYLKDLHETNRMSARGQPGYEQVARYWTESHLDELAQPFGYATRLIVRDTASGLSGTLDGPTLQIPGLTVTHAGDFADLTAAPSEAAITGSVELPAEGAWVVEAVQLIAAREYDTDRSLELELTLSADGREVGAAGEWSADVAMPRRFAQPYLDALAAVPEPEWTIETETITSDDGTTTMTFVRPLSNKPDQPQAIIDTSAPTWRLTAVSAPGRLTVAPAIAFVGVDPQSVMTGQPGAASAPLPVAVTRDLADAATLEVGATLEVAAFGARMPATVAAITPAVPGTTNRYGLLADSAAVSAQLTPRATTLRWPSELWATVDGELGPARAEAARIPGISAVRITDDATARHTTAAQSLWIAAGSALLLSLTGLAAAAATQLGARRSEVAVLRALGMTAREQGASRAWETGGVLAVATVTGIGAGWLVGWLTLEPIVRAGSDGGASYVSPPSQELGPWLVMLAVGAVAVAAILWLLTRAVRRQALDGEYREEVR